MQAERTPTGDEDAAAEEAVVYGGGRFAIQKKLGAGGMGVVYEAYDRNQDALVALKTLKNISADGLYLFKNEFRALADLHHPNLVRLGELFCDGDLWFFTMELLQGSDLLAYVRTVTRPADPLTMPVTVTPQNFDHTMPHAARDTVSLVTAKNAGTIPLGKIRLTDSTRPPSFVWSPTSKKGHGGLGYDDGRLRKTFAQLASGLSALHAAGKVHRDIKPSNVMVTSEGRVVLLDFGLVSDTAGDSSLDQIIGTPLYMAPEQPMSVAVDPGMDWYSVGVMLYEALTGQPPYTASTLGELLKAKQYQPLPPGIYCSDVAMDLDTLCHDLLHPDPKARPTGTEICARLGVQQGPSSSPTLNAFPASQRGRAAQPFVGHERELSELENAFADSRKGQPVAVLIYGESGVGKSTLVHHFLDSLGPGLNALVLSGRCYEQEFVPYKAFDGIVDALCRHLLSLQLRELRAMLPPEGALLARLFPVLGRLSALSDTSVLGWDEEDPGELRGRAFTALREILSRLSADRPLVIFVDDLQWSDGDSLLLLKELLRRPGGSYLVLASVRGSRDEMMSERGRLHLLRDMKQEIRHVSVERLSAEEARSLVQQLSGATGDEAEALIREAEGHPLFLQELSLYAHRLGGSKGTLVARLDDALTARIGDLDDKVRSILELVALAGAPIAQRTLASAARQSPADLSLHVSSLRTAHLVKTQGRLDTDTIEPYHDRIREAVAARLDADVKKGHHKVLAEALEEAGAAETEPQMLVLHFEAAGEGVVAAKHAEQAAVRARKALAFDQAAELFRTALRLGRHDVDKVQRLRLSLGEALGSAGRGVEAAEVFLAAASTADVTLRVECRMRAAEHLIGAGHVDRGADLMRGVLREVGEDLPGPRKALGVLVWTRAKLGLRGMKYTPVKEGSSPSRELLRWGIYRALYLSLSPIQPIVGGLYHFKSVALALELGEVRCLAECLPPLIVVLSLEGPRGVEHCRKLLRTAQGLVHSSRQESYFRGLLFMAEGAIVAWGEGKVREAEAASREAEALFKSAGAAKPLATTRVLYSTVLYFMGAYRELSGWGRELVQDAIRRQDRYAEYTFTHLNAIGWLVEDTPDELRKCMDNQTPWTPMETDYQYQHSHALRAEVDLGLYVGQPQQALEVLRRHLRATPLILKNMPAVMGAAYWSAIRLLLATAKNARDPALSEAEAFAKKLQRLGHLVTDTQSEIARAGIALRRGNAEGAMRLLLKAEQLAGATGMADTVAAVQWRRGEILGGEEGKVLVERARGTLSTLGAKRPDRMLEVLAPGFRF